MTTIVSLSMNKFIVCLSLSLFSIPLLSSCTSTSSTSKPVSRQITKNVSPDKILDVTLHEGITTKGQVIASIGKPHNIFRSSEETILSYDTDGYRITIKLTYIEKSGNTYNYLINRKLKTDDLEIFFDKNDIVRGIKI